MDEKGISSDGRVGVLNARQYYSLIQQVGDNGLVNRDAQVLLVAGNGIVEIAGIKIYKSQNIFLGKYGVKYGGTTGETSPTPVTSSLRLLMQTLAVTRMTTAPTPNWALSPAV